MASQRGGFTSHVRWETSRPAVPFGVAAWGLAATLLVLAYLLGGPGIATGVREWASNLVTIVMAVLMAVTCGGAAARAAGRTRRAWALLAAAGASWSVAEVLWLVESELLESELSPAVSDVFYLSALPFAGAALVFFPPPMRSVAERTRTLLGALVVGGSVLFVSRALALSVILPAASGSWLEQAVYIAYPVSDVVLASLALVALMRVGLESRLHVILLSVALLLFSVADTAYVRLAVTDSYVAGSWLDWGWVAGYALFALAALVPYASLDPAQAPPKRPRRYDWSALALYLPLLVAVVVATTLSRAAPDVTLIVIGALTLVIFAVRQSLLSGDHALLSHRLQSQVGQLQLRTDELGALASQNEGIIASVGDGVFGVDAGGTITFVNPQAAVMLGRPPEELVGSPEHVISYGSTQTSSPEHTSSPPVRSALWQALASGDVVSGSRARFHAGDGSVFPVELTIGPIRQAGQITGAVVVFRDVSARLAVEKMKDEFASVVSHELKTPLTSIRGSLGLLASGLGGELSLRGSRMVSIALESSERLSRLIADMLDLERMEAGSLALVPVACEVRPLVNTALNEVDAVARQYGVRVSAEDMDGVVQGDSDRIVQALTNVLSNSIKFSPRGGTVTVSMSQRGPMVEFAVTDHGRGIPRERIGRIFDRFEQVDSADAREHGGTGLGLSISRDIIALHGGSIWVESELARGSTFRFTLPGTARGRAQDRLPVASGKAGVAGLQPADDDYTRDLDGVAR